MKFVSEETFTAYQAGTVNDMEILDPSTDLGNLTPRSRTKKSDSLGWFERIHARYAPSRRLRHRFFEDQILVDTFLNLKSIAYAEPQLIRCWQDRYESAYQMVAGDLKVPIQADKVPDFLQILFPSFPYRFSTYNVKEVFELFGRNGVKSKDLFWADIRKGLREQKTATLQGEPLIIESALNPKSWFTKYWANLMKFVATYHFLIVPVRIMFIPWKSMVDYRALCTDLIADAFTVANVVVLMNTAHLSSRATWVTKRLKILRRMDIGYVIAAVPLDWYCHRFKT